MKIIILTGAGISAESGLPTFRGEDGLWEGYRIDQVATKQAFGANPELVNGFYNERRRKLVDVKPNAAHHALADLERHLEDDFLLITQNIDDLHERAGSDRLIHMHGELLKKRCIWCGIISPCDHDIHAADVCGKCRREMGMRPDVVWFGEAPYGLPEIHGALESCSHFIVIGSSGVVEPASRFAAKARVYGACTIEVNLEKTARSGDFDEIILGPASLTVPGLVRGLVASIA